jgi:NTE family protein
MNRSLVAVLAGLAIASLCQGQEIIAPPGPSRPRIALVLEGGGALGLAHIGALKVLEEMGVPIDMVVGTSMGSIVGGLYSVGYDAGQLEGIMEGMDWGEMFSEDSRSERRAILNDIRDARYFAEIEFDAHGFRTRGGLLSGRNILGFFDRLTLGAPADFDELPRRYRAVATDLESGDAVALSRGSLADAMRASMSFPAIFAPYYLGGRYLVDGGVADNLPVDVAKGMGADLVIAVDLQGGSAYDPKKSGLSSIDAVTRSFDQLTQANSKLQLSSADFVITVDLKGYWITDFAKGAEILRLGEKAARGREAELRAFLTGAGALEAPAAPSIPPAPAVLREPISALLVEGAVSEKDKAEARSIYSGAIGLADSGPFLESAYRALDAKGKYEFIRLRVDPSAGRRTLVVSLAKKPEPGDSLRLGLAYSSFFADAISNKLVVTPGMVLRGFPAKGSELHVDATMLDTPGIEVDLVQPFLDSLDLRASLSARSDIDTYYDASAANYQYQTLAASGGVFLETGYLAHELLSLGWRADLLGGDDISAIYSCPTVRRASLLLLSSEYRRLDHPALPTSGLFVKADFGLSSRRLGSERDFQTLLGKCGAYVPVGAAGSIGFKGIMGTDFSLGSGGGDAAPLYYRPALSDRTLFPAPLSIGETMGSFVAGGGIDLKFSLRRPEGLVNIPLYAIVTAAAGAAIQDAEAFRAGNPPWHMNASLGLGIRFDDAFSVYARAGGNRNADGALKPFLAVDIGAIPL